MTRVLVLWADDASPNLGVRVLAEGTAALVREAWPDALVDYANYGSWGSAPLPLGNPRSLVKEWLVRHGMLGPWFKQYDIMIDTRAGDSFSDIYGLQRLVTMSLVAEYADRQRVPVVLGPQTLGPLMSMRARALARRSLRTASLTMVRDRASADQAKVLRHPADVVTTDVVFALPIPRREQARDVLLNISGLLWRRGPHVDAARYRCVLAELYKALGQRGRRVTLLAHVLDSPFPDNDVPAVREFAAEYAPDAEIIIPASLDGVRQVMAGAQLVVGSRMHACLNALSVGTPAIPLAYSRKFKPLLNDLGWHHTVDLRSDREIVEKVMAAVEEVDLLDQVKAVNECAQSKLELAVSSLRGLL